jgi:hypothetical protein
VAIPELLPIARTVWRGKPWKLAVQTRGNYTLGSRKEVHVSATGQGQHGNGAIRQANVVENMDTDVPSCNLLSVDTQDAAQSNTQQLYRMITALAGQTFDPSAWVYHYSSAPVITST